MNLVIRRIVTGVMFWTINAAAGHAQTWPAYGGDDGGQRFSTLTQIDRETVGGLELAWSYRTGDLEKLPKPFRSFGSFHATPILVPADAGQSLILCTPLNRIVALDPTTGEVRWQFDAEVEVRPFARYNCRGVAYWRNLTAPRGGPCTHRVFMGTEDLRVVSVDALDGERCRGFGQGGEVDVEPEVSKTMADFRPGDVHFSSPPAIVGDVVVLGSSDNTKFQSANNPSGAVRAFDARTGERVWTFDPIPRNEGDPQAASWTPDALARTGSANVWSMMTVDQERDLVFLPTATAGPNFYGGDRPGDNRYANSVVAVRGSTGRVVWHFQTLHHDVWDLDLPAAPILADIAKDGVAAPVVIQLTKQGLTFVFHRETGEPYFPVEERPVPTDGVEGETLSPTQPFPTAPPPLAPLTISPDDAWGFTLYDRAQCRAKIEGLRTGSLYTPPSRQGTAIRTPGVNNWGGGAFVPGRNLLIAPVSLAPAFIRVLPVAEVDRQDLTHVMAGMPFGPPGRIEGTDMASQYGPLLSPLQAPCVAPPWAELVAVDMGEGKIKWRVPLGTLEKLVPGSLSLPFGTAIAGGPIATAGGLVFIGATMDEKFRAFDIDSGEELWSAATPTASMSTPMTYEVDGRQFVVVASGGHMWNYPQKVGDYLIAFALPG